MAEVLTPKGKMDLAAVTAFHAELEKRKDGDLTIDLEEVTHLGALCLQALIAAARHVTGAGHKFSIENTDDRVLGQLSAMGMNPETIEKGAP